MEMTRLRFQDLLGEAVDEQQLRLSQGQMLLLCLNGLFDKVESGLVKLANHLRNQPVPKQRPELLEQVGNRMVSLSMAFCLFCLERN